MTANKNKMYAAVTVSTCLDSCAAARAHSGKKLLINEFEQLILKYCRKPLCVCDFQQHADRRSRVDRRYIAQNLSHPLTINNRRMSYGRRAEDVHNRARDKSGEIDLTKAIFKLLT